MSPKSIAIVAIVAVVAAIAYPNIRKSRDSSKLTAAEFQANVVKAYQARVPYTPRPHMIIYKVEVIDNVLTYGVRLDDKNEGEVREGERADIRRAVTDVLCKEEEASVFRDRGITTRATIGDRTGTPITTVAVLPNSC